MTDIPLRLNAEIDYATHCIKCAVDFDADLGSYWECYVSVQTFASKHVCVKCYFLV